MRAAATALFALVLAVGSSPSDAEDDLSAEPYVVYVAKSNTHARCGPSEDYYRTDALRHGQSLDVYAETEDGWLGIRPPEDSFCWVIADSVDISAGSQEGTINEDRTVAWIGTHLGRARKYRWQVQLAKGEPVSVIGRSEREGPDGPQLWYRVVPPSGEFRWIHRDDTVDSSEKLIRSLKGQEQGVVAQSDMSENEFEPVGRTDVPDRDPRNALAGEPKRVDPVTDSGGTSRRRTDSRPPSILQRTDEVVGSGLRQTSASATLGQPTVAQPTVAQANGATTARTETQATQSPTQNEGPPRTLKEAVTRGGLLATVEFLGGPKLTDIGPDATAPNAAVTAGDSNWVASMARTFNGRQAAPVPTPLTRDHGVQQVSATASLPRGNTPQSGGAATGTHLNLISSERIAAIEAETRGADVDRLSLIFSRLMAARSSAAEAEPVAQAAILLATTAPDELVRSRARLLAERVDQYQRVSRRRDGAEVVRSTQPPQIPGGPGSVAQVNAVSPAERPVSISPGPNSYAPASHSAASTVPLSPLPAAMQTPPTAGPEGPSLVEQTGHLVQVYSARANSPPFALTDSRGRTLVYVTPSPGVNVRMYLNSHVKVIGRQGFLRGLNTPHILATKAFRAPE